MCKKILAYSLFVLFFVPCAAEASILGSLLTFDGNEDLLEDKSRTMIFDQDNNDIITVGDQFVGAIRLDNVNGGSSLNRFFSIVAFEVTGVDFVTGDISLGAIASTEANSLYNILAGSGLSLPAAAAIQNKTIGIVIENANPTAGAGTVNTVNPYDDSYLMVGANGGTLNDGVDFIQHTVTAAKGWDYVATFGIETGANRHGDQDFFTANYQNFSTISGIQSQTSGQVLRQRAGFSVLDHVFGLPTEFLGVAIDYNMRAPEYDTGVFPPVLIDDNVDISYHDFILEPDGIVNATSLSGWDVQDEGNFRINAVPEPSSIAIFGVLLGIGGLVTRFNKRSKS